MVGGVDHDASPFNRVIQARRQPGSAFKAFVYGAAVERGAIRPTDIRQDAPISYAGWNPENYEGGYAGKVTLAEALARSLNTVSVRLTLEVGPDTVADFARRLGLVDIPVHPGPSIALGAYEVTPLELAAGYQVFQTGGGRTTPYLISEIRSTRGDVIYAHATSAPTPVMDPLFATRLVGMLKTVITAGTGTGANIGRPAAGKTGTSQSWRDAWFVGFTPDILTAVWVGNDNGAPMAKVTGGELPAAIWKRFMTVAEKNYPSRDFPWLVAEPPNEGPSLTNATEDTTAYRDEPPMTGDLRDTEPRRYGRRQSTTASPPLSSPATDDRRRDRQRRRAGSCGHPRPCALLAQQVTAPGQATTPRDASTMDPSRRPISARPRPIAVGASSRLTTSETTRRRRRAGRRLIHRLTTIHAIAISRSRV